MRVSFQVAHIRLIIKGKSLFPASNSTVILSPCKTAPFQQFLVYEVSSSISIYKMFEPHCFKDQLPNF